MIRVLPKGELPLVLEHHLVSACARATRFTLGFRARDRGFLQCPLDLDRATSMGVMASPARYDTNQAGTLRVDLEICPVHQPGEVRVVFIPLPEKYRDLEKEHLGILQGERPRRALNHAEKRQTVSARHGFDDVERRFRQSRHRGNLPKGVELLRLPPLQVNRRCFSLRNKQRLRFAGAAPHEDEAATRPTTGLPLWPLGQGALTVGATRFGFHPSPFRLTSHSHQSSLQVSRQKPVTGIGVPKPRRRAGATIRIGAFFMPSTSYGGLRGGSLGSAGFRRVPVRQPRAVRHPFPAWRQAVTVHSVIRRRTTP